METEDIINGKKHISIEDQAKLEVYAKDSCTDPFFVSFFKCGFYSSAVLCTFTASAGLDLDDFTGVPLLLTLACIFGIPFFYMKHKENEFYRIVELKERAVRGDEGYKD